MSSAPKMKLPRRYALIFCSLFFCVSAQYNLLAAETRQIIEPGGVTVTIPQHAERIACLYHPAYDKILMMCGPARIGLLPGSATKWAYKFYPGLKDKLSATTGITPDAERLLSLNIDLIIYPKGKIHAAAIEQSHIPAVCPFDSNYYPRTMDEYTEDFKRQIMFFSKVLGPETEKRAAAYCAYLERISNRVKAITSKIPEREKPRVYYGKTGDLFATQGNNTIMSWYTELAGGVYLPKVKTSYFATVNMEQLTAWNPDIVFLGTSGKPSAENETAIKNLKAFKNGNVYRIPAGIFYWDMTSCETALLPLYLGKKMHPKLFSNWDIVAEMKKFYAEIYGITMTDADAKRILEGLAPQ